MIYKLCNVQVQFHVILPKYISFPFKFVDKESAQWMSQDKG